MKSSLLPDAEAAMTRTVLPLFIVIISFITSNAYSQSILVWDKDHELLITDPEGAGMVDATYGITKALTDCGYAHSVTNSIPSDLSPYDILFIIMGNYGPGMTDYELTAVQQQQIISFLNSGYSVYIEGNDFGYYHSSDPVYSMFGCSFGGDDDKVMILTGDKDTIMENSLFEYSKGGYSDDYMDWIFPLAGDPGLRSEEGKSRFVSYAGPNGTYRAIHAAFWFGAIVDSVSNFKKKDLMAAFMRYLKGDSLVIGLTETASMATRSHVDLFLENEKIQGGRTYTILGSVSGVSPGIAVGGIVIPINYDLVTSLFISIMNTPMLNNFSINLDGNGKSMATFDTLSSIDPGLVGLKIYFAYVLMKPMDFASNPVIITIVN